MGHSEGGHTVSEYGGSGFIAQIMLGMDCRQQGGSPYAPSGTALLNIVGSEDEFGYGDGCNIWEDNKGSRDLIIEGAHHNVAGHPEAIEAVTVFLKKCCNISSPAKAFDIEKAARELLSEYGDMAAVVAYQKSEDSMDAGDVAGYRNWLEVHKRIYKISGY